MIDIPKSLERVFVYQQTVRKQLLRALSETKLLLSQSDYQQVRYEVMSEGTRLWHMFLTSLSASCQVRDWRKVTSEIGIDVQVFPRVLGFGYLQTQALAMAMCISPKVFPKAGQLGALFNLGIALFDFICDRHPTLAPSLLSFVTPFTLEQMLRGEKVTQASANIPVVSLLLSLISTFLQETMTFEGSLATRQELYTVIKQMYEAELEVMQMRRSSFETTSLLWEQLEQKSVLPMWTMALVGLHLSRPEILSTRVQLLKPIAMQAGKLFWIVDDLIDAPEDWLADEWSRPWYLWARLVGAANLPPTSVEDAILSLLESGIVTEEIHLLVRTFHNLQEMLSATPQSFPLSICLRATIQSWIYGLPG